MFVERCGVMVVVAFLGVVYILEGTTSRSYSLLDGEETGCQMFLNAHKWAIGRTHFQSESEFPLYLMIDSAKYGTVRIRTLNIRK